MSLLLNSGYQFIPCTATMVSSPFLQVLLLWWDSWVFILYHPWLESDCSNKEFTRFKAYLQLTHALVILFLQLTPYTNFLFLAFKFSSNMLNYRGCSVLDRDTATRLQSTYKFQHKPEFFLTNLTLSDCDKAVRDHLIGYFFFFDYY